jgi:hypothetical protein
MVTAPITAIMVVLVTVIAAVTIGPRVPAPILCLDLMTAP